MAEVRWPARWRRSPRYRQSRGRRVPGPASWNASASIYLGLRTTNSIPLIRASGRNRSRVPGCDWRSTRRRRRCAAVRYFEHALEMHPAHRPAAADDPGHAAGAQSSRLCSRNMPRSHPARSCPDTSRNHSGCVRRRARTDRLSDRSPTPRSSRPPRTRDRGSASIRSGSGSSTITSSKPRAPLPASARRNPPGDIVADLGLGPGDLAAEPRPVRSWRRSWSAGRWRTSDRSDRRVVSSPGRPAARGRRRVGCATGAAAHRPPRRTDHGSVGSNLGVAHARGHIHGVAALVAVEDRRAEQTVLRQTAGEDVADRQVQPAVINIGLQRPAVGPVRNGCATPPPPRRPSRHLVALHDRVGSQSRL